MAKKNSSKNGLVLVLSTREKKLVRDHFAIHGLTIGDRAFYNYLHYRSDSEDANRVRDYIVKELRIKPRSV